MQVINASELIFTPDDALVWATFLNSQTGRRLIPKLAEAVPRLLSKGDTNEILIRNGELLGFQTALQVLLELSVAPQAAPASVNLFPALEDDSQWPKQ